MKVLKKVPNTHTHLVCKKKTPLIYQDQAGMFDAKPTLVESPKVQIRERNFVFLAFL
jgi:hypothetical protein